MAKADHQARKLQRSGGERGLEQDWRQEGQLQWEAGRGWKGYTTARAGTSNTRAVAQDPSSLIQDQVAGMPAAEQAALFQTLTAALSKSVAGDKGGKR
jgi:hypothetical protein